MTPVDVPRTAGRPPLWPPAQRARRPVNRPLTAPEPASDAEPDAAPEPSAELAAALRGYLDHLAVERGVARNTLLSYRRDLQRYLLFLAAAGRTRIVDVTAADVSQFLVCLRTGADGRPPLAASSAARAVVAARGWHRFLLQEGTTDADPSRDVRPPTPARRLPKALPVESVTRLLDAAGSADPTGPRGLRDRALLELLYATGARISEAVGLDVDDIDLGRSPGAGNAHPIPTRSPRWSGCAARGPRSAWCRSVRTRCAPWRRTWSGAGRRWPPARPHGTPGARCS